DADTFDPLRRGGGAFIGGLHESGTTTGHNVASHFRQRRDCAFCFLIGRAARRSPSGTKNRYSVTIAPRGLQPSEIVDGVPKTEHRINNDLLYGIFIRKANPTGLIRCRIAAHKKLLLEFARSSVLLFNLSACWYRRAGIWRT